MRSLGLTGLIDAAVCVGNRLSGGTPHPKNLSDTRFAGAKPIVVELMQSLEGLRYLRYPGKNENVRHSLT